VKKQVKMKGKERIMENNRFVKMLRKKGTIKSRVRWKNRTNRK